MYQLNYRYNLKQLLMTLALFFSVIISVNVNADPVEDKLNQIQLSIKQDVELLKNSKGELAKFAEYRVQQQARKLHLYLAELISSSEQHTKILTAEIPQYLQFLTTVEHHYRNDIAKFKQEFGSNNDASVMMKIAAREYDRNILYQDFFDALSWAKKLSIDVEDDEQIFIDKLLERAENLESLVLYTQHHLKETLAEVSIAGKDVDAELTAKVNQLNERLQLTSTSLESTINLLDSSGQDTASFKQSLFSISGDITQDVLNIDVAASLLEKWWNTAKTQAIENGPGVTFKLSIFFIILFITYLISKATQKLVTKAVTNSKLKFSQLLQEFFISLSSKVVFTLGFLVALSQLGFELAPLLAGFGVAGIVIGFALQDTLSNFASGMMILIYRPFDVGNLINAAGVTGTVSHMSLVSTTIKTLDNQRLIIPNNKIWGDTINNITAERQRRVDMVFGIGYGDDIAKTEKVLEEIVANHPKVLKFPAAVVKLHTLGESSVDFVVRPWAQPDDYWDVYWDITREVKMRFDAENISIPFPQRDLHIYQANKE